ncbi:alpha-galactosidase [Mycobacterium sp. KBS0706]|uniref:glycoside hydrolase family 36 protein n=1 Tax=Mycobacterium sp. KBS0706 TaxID=2578109 RepID=UPI00110FBB7F|nr:glycoside hydrolase family 36 protein [Mycobacterium sp. KBS0706]TSD89976.1 alpha-galactosidase [Mycobacterium sp. KBS0706]
MRFDADALAFHGSTLRLADIAPVIDGEAVRGAPDIREVADGWAVEWPVEGGQFRLEVERRDFGGTQGVAFRFMLDGRPTDRPLSALGIEIGRAGPARAYLRTGYHSWDGSFYVTPDRLAGDEKARTGFAMTQLLPREGDGGVVLAALRHDRFQHRFSYRPAADDFAITLETLWDHAPQDGHAVSEWFALFEHAEVEDGLRAWARAVAEASSLPPRVSDERITGWCSWYNLYAAITEGNLLDHLEGARQAKAEGLPLRVFQIDDGFTPEMGDWLEVKPQFPRGMAPLLAEIAAAGFVPGLWIAPFLVGNRSRLYRDHPDWVVRQRDRDEPLAYSRFYGEFRWHKRSEEYYVLDITHPGAEAHIRRVFRTWARDWGCRYFKTDFMNAGSEFGPDRARWHRDGLTRIEIWMRMARLIREEIGDALWLGCGSPIFAPVGLVDAMRIGRDIGVSWSGHQSAESLLRDQTTRSFANGILWQADPDCILLRDRFHELSDIEVDSLARFAGLAGGVLMTSDHLGELSPARKALLRELLADGKARPCDFPRLGAAIGRPDPDLIVQRVRGAPGGELVSLFNASDHPFEGTVLGAGTVSLRPHETSTRPRP